MRGCPPAAPWFPGVALRNMQPLFLSQAEMRGPFEVESSRDRLGNLGPLPAIFPRHDAPMCGWARTVRVG